MTAGGSSPAQYCWDAGDERWIAAALSAPVTTPLVRISLYQHPAVVLGRGQRVLAGVAQRATDLRVALVARQTGGGAVLAGPWLLGAAVILPPQHPFVLPGIAESFRWLGDAHAEWLQGLEVRARCVLPAEVRLDRSMAWACFASASHWEIEADGRKIVGLSQARKRNGVLFSSGVLVSRCAWPLLCEILGESNESAAALAQRTASCAEMLGRAVYAAALAPSLLDALHAALAGAP